MKILMIDDDEVGMRGLKRLLEDDGHKVDFAKEPATAEGFLRANTYEVIILDIMMPYGTKLTKAETNDTSRTGEVILKRVREGKYGRNQRARTIVYTAKLSDTGLPNRLATLDVGEDDLYYKPGYSMDIVKKLARKA